MGKASEWQFTKRFRCGGFGWRASRRGIALGRHDELIELVGSDPRPM